MTITLPDDVREQAERQAKAAGFASVEEYVADLVREDELEDQTPPTGDIRTVEQLRGAGLAARRVCGCHVRQTPPYCEGGGMTLIVRQQADDDMTAMTTRIAATSPRTAQRFVDRLNRTFGLLETFPLLGSVPPTWLGLDPAIRFMTMRRYYRVVIVYLPLPDGVEIVRVVEGNRDLATVLGDP